MDSDIEFLQSLVERPAESLAVEVKRWLDPEKPEHVALLIRAILALRNRNGGHLVIGFNNDMKPDQSDPQSDVRSKYHVDKIQRLVGQYSSEVFEVKIGYPRVNEQDFPVIIIPHGVKSPAAVKSDLLHPEEKGKKLLTTDDVYVRTLKSNNTPSTAKASWKDWPNIIDVMFDNREADIGRFLRRQLGGISTNSLKAFLDNSSESITPIEPPNKKLENILNDGEQRYRKAVAAKNIEIPSHGAWEVALVISGELVPTQLNRGFIQMLEAVNPAYTGWPVWLDSSSFSNQDAAPYVLDGAWESLIAIFDGMNHLDFMRKDPAGVFYLRRAFQDDLSSGQRAPKPMTVLDPILMTYRVAETLAVGLAFAKALCRNPAQTTLRFAFRWTELKGRTLTSWANFDRYISSRKAQQDRVISFVDLSLETPTSALSSFVGKAIAPLLQVFEGFEIGSEVLEDLTRRVIERRM